MLVCLLLLQSSSVGHLSNYKKLLEVESKYIGVSKYNNYTLVLRFLASCKIKSYANWCAAFQKYSLDETGLQYKVPTNPAVARSWVNKKSISAKLVYGGYVKLDTNKIYLAIWIRDYDWTGHIGFVIKWNKKSGWLIEGNTSDNDTRQGGNVEKKYQTISLYSSFRIAYFTAIDCL